MTNPTTPPIGELPALPKPTIYRTTWDGGGERKSWSQYHDENDPLPTEWDDDEPDLIEGFYSGDQLRAAIEADRAASHVAVPAGWKLVPMEPAPDMVRAGQDCKLVGRWHAQIKTVYAAMLAAAPSQAPATQAVPTTGGARDER